LFTFGKYPQNANGKDQTPIEWIKLETEGNRVLVLSSKILDCSEFHNKRDINKGFNLRSCDFVGYYNMNEVACRSFWKGSYLYKCLNTDNYGFFRKATLTEAEKRAIEDRGNGRAFCLSVEEAKVAFAADNTTDWGYYKQYLTGYKGLEDYLLTPLGQATGTDYTKKGVLFSILYVDKGVYDKKTVTEYKGRAWWWLRSPGSSAGTAAIVHSDGRVYVDGLDVRNYRVGVRPALWLNL
jgi:hypothetical protein